MGLTSTCMKLPCWLTLLTRICVPVFGTFDAEPARLVTTDVRAGRGMAVGVEPPGLRVVEHGHGRLRRDRRRLAVLVDRDRVGRLEPEGRVERHGPRPDQMPVGGVRERRMRIDREDQAAARVVADVVVG